MAQTVNISELSLQQLEGLKNQLDQEVEFLSSSIAQLKVVQTKYVEAKDCLNVLTPSNEGKDLLVPLTSSNIQVTRLDAENVPSIDSCVPIGTVATVRTPEVSELSHIKTLALRVDMYVPGKLNDVQHVLIDVGTGYYVEQSADRAKDFFKRKVEFLTKQIEKIQPALQEKHAMKQAVMEMMSMKIQQLSAAQAAAKA